MENLQLPFRLAVLFASLVLCSSGLAAPEAKRTLLDLAKEKFAPRVLTEAEEKLFEFTEKGEIASMLPVNNEANDPASASEWPENRTIYATSLAWLCTDAAALPLVTHRGIQFSGMRIVGDLNLSDVKMVFPFVARNCSFEGNIFLMDARLRTTALMCCSLQGLDASRAHVEGDAVLAYGSDAHGPVNFSGATIQGNLNFEDSHLRLGLAAEWAKIGSEVRLNKGFNGEGGVLFGGATIGGNLSCEQAHFSNPWGTALSGDTSKVDGFISFRESTADGALTFVAAIIGRSVDLDGSRISNNGQRVFDAGVCKIGGNFFARNFEAGGEVNLIGSTMGGNLELDGAWISNPKGTALQAERVNVGGNVFLRPRSELQPFRSDGEVNLMGALIGGSLHCQRARFANPGKNALMADGCKITGYVSLHDVVPDGTVDFGAAVVEDTFYWVDVEVRDTTILKLQSAKLGTLHGHKEKWPDRGNLYLDGLVYNRIQDETPTESADRIDWLARQPDHLFFPQPYEQLASVLRTMGREKEARDVMVGKNERNQKFTKTSTEWWWYNVIGWAIGYGYLPSLPFLWSLVFIVLGWLLFGFAHKRGLIAPTKDSAYEKREGTAEVIANLQRPIAESYSRFNAFVYSLEAFTPLLKLDQTSNWAPNANRGIPIDLGRVEFTTGGLFRVYLWIHIILGWILTSLWVGSITGLVKT